ncbi:MAG: hypothetical protein J6Q54_00235 [Oscillospiraceae bacterium]|nr:hypothetical protein [Oscillospiraceae bacterium]
MGYARAKQFIEHIKHPAFLVQDNGVLCANTAGRTYIHTQATASLVMVNSYMDLIAHTGGVLFTKVALENSIYNASVINRYGVNIIVLETNAVPLYMHKEMELITKLREPLFNALIGIDMFSKQNRTSEILTAKLSLYRILQTIQNTALLATGSSEEHPVDSYNVAKHISDHLERISKLPSMHDRVPTLEFKNDVYCNISADRFDFAFFNLLSNALKHSPPKSPIEVVLRQSNGKLYITVKNIYKPMEAYKHPNWSILSEAKTIEADLYDLGLGPSIKLARDFAVEHDGTLFCNITHVEEAENTYEVEFTLSLPELHQQDVVLRSPPPFIAEENAGFDDALVLLSDLLNINDLR